MLNNNLPAMDWRTMAQAAGRFPGSQFREHLALLATGENFGASALLEHARSGNLDVTANFDPEGLGWFGYFLASEYESPTHIADTVALFRLMCQISRNPTRVKELNTVWLQACVLEGCLDEFRSVLARGRVDSSARWAGDADALHPGLVHPEAHEWANVFNRPFRAAKLEQIQFFEGEGPAFDRMTVKAPLIEGTSGPLVTVVVPVHNPGPTLRATVRSLVAQTWPHLEILLCDDASTEGADLFAEVVAMDSRIRHVQAPRNGGAYAARNMGIGLAAGDYVTFNDADDWSHPRRIEHQLRAVEGSRTARASMSSGIRTSGEMRLTVLGMPPKRINRSSILVGRMDILNELGGFDAMRKGADSEFEERFTARFGEDALVKVPEPLSLIQLTAGSLSRNDIRFLRTHPARPEYVRSYRHWHAELRAQGRSAYVSPGTRGPFPAPDHLSSTPKVETKFDVMILANLTTGSPTVADLATEVTALTDAGLRVGLMECLAPFDLTKHVGVATGALAEVINRGTRRILFGEPVQARLLLVRDPAGVTSMPDRMLAGVRASRAVVIADYSPDHGGGYQPSLVAAALKAQTGAAEVSWAPATGDISARIIAHDPTARLGQPSVFVAMPDSPDGVLTSNSATPVIGIPIEASQRAVPPLDQLLEDIGVHPARLITWGSSETNDLAAGHVDHVRSTTCTERDFVRGIDILLVHELPHRGAHTSTLIVQALQAGRVVLLPPEFRAHFEDAALYLDNVDLLSVLEAWTTITMDEQRHRARAWVEARLTAESVRDAILPLLMTEKEAGEA